MAATTKDFKKAGKFISENSDEIQGIIKGIKGDSKDFSQIFSSVNSILEDVDSKATTTHNQVQNTVNLGRDAEKNPNRDEIKEFEIEHEKEIKEIKKEEDELGKGLKKIEGSEQLLEGDLEHLNKCMQNTDDVIRELNVLVDHVNQNGLNEEKLESLSEFIELGGRAIRMEAQAHKFILGEVESLVKLNENALTDMHEIETDIKGIEQEDQEGEELAQETHNKGLAKQEEQDEEMVNTEENEFKKEEREEEKITEEIETELNELKEELKHTEEEMNKLESEIQALRSASKSMRQRMSGSASSTISNKFQNAEKELQDASDIINNVEGEYPKVKNMVEKEENQASSL